MTVFTQSMNRTIAPNFGKPSIAGLRRLCRVLAGFIGIFLLTVGPVQAEPIQINRVVQTLKSLQGTTDLQLTLVAQDPVTSGTRTSNVGPTGNVGSSDPKIDALLSGFPIVASNVDIGVDDIDEEGEVDGTICDCGEILIAGGGFAKWPLVFLAAVPLAFIPDCDDCDEQNEPTPTPTPSRSETPTPTPEPASLLIFGTGLVAFGARLRRRYTRAKLGRIQKTEEESD